MSALQQAAAGWAAWTWPRALEFALLALALLLADRFLLRRAWPRLRLALHAVVLLELLLPRFAALPWSLGLAAAPDVSAAALPQAASDGFDVSSFLPTVLPIAFLAWIAVAIALAAGALVRQSRARRRVLAADLGASAMLLGRVAAAARSLGLRRTPRVVVLADLASPAVLGAWDPILLVPAALDRDAVASVVPPAVTPSSGDELEHALLHELLHLKRGDLPMAAAMHLVAIAWWFHPLAWIVARRASSLRELSCDDDVVRVLRERAPAYRATLLERARRFVEVVDAPRLGGSIGFLASPSSLLARLEWLSRPRRIRPRTERGVTWLAAGALALAALPAVPPERDDDALSKPTIPANSELDAIRAAAFEVVRAASGGQRPPGCLQLRHAVMTCLASSEKEKTP